MKKVKNMRTYYVDFNVFDEESGVFKVSIVKNPAIESNFVALSKEKLIFSKDEEKQTITGALLIPDKEILRIDEEGEYNLIFQKETIEGLRNKFHKKNYTHEVNLEHSSDVDDVFLIESWIKEDENDKSTKLGFDLPIGTWFATYKIENKELFEKIKTNEFNGFSIEAFIDKNIKKLQKEMKNKEKLSEENKGFLANFFKKMSEFVSVKGTFPDMNVDFVDAEDPSQEEKDPMETLKEEHNILLDKYNKMVEEMMQIKADVDALMSEKNALATEKDALVTEKGLLTEELSKLKSENEKNIEKLSKIEDEDSTGKLKTEKKEVEIPNWKKFAERLKTFN